MLVTTRVAAVRFKSHGDWKNTSAHLTLDRWVAQKWSQLHWCRGDQCLSWITCESGILQLLSLKLAQVCMVVLLMCIMTSTIRLTVWAYDSVALSRSALLSQVLSPVKQVPFGHCQSRTQLYCIKCCVQKLNTVGIPLHTSLSEPSPSKHTQCEATTECVPFIL